MIGDGVSGLLKLGIPGGCRSDPGESLYYIHVVVGTVVKEQLLFLYLLKVRSRA